MSTSTFTVRTSRPSFQTTNVSPWRRYFNTLSKPGRFFNAPEIWSVDTGRLHVESLSSLLWNRCPASPGMGVQVARNTHLCPPRQRHRDLSPAWRLFMAVSRYRHRCRSTRITPASSPSNPDGGLNGYAPTHVVTVHPPPMKSLLKQPVTGDNSGT